MLWGYEKKKESKEDCFSGRVKKLGGEEKNIYWSCSGMTDENLENRIEGHVIHSPSSSIR